MKKFLQSHWAAVLIGAVAYCGTLGALWRPTLAMPPRPRPVQDRLKAFDFSNVKGAEMDLLITNLKAARTELEQREEKLEQWDARLKAEHLELTRLADQVDQKRAEFDALVVRIQTNEATSFMKLAGTYTQMSPAAAAKILKGISDEKLLKIMAYMEREPLAGVLESFAETDAKRAAILTERLRLVVTPATNAPPADASVTP
jgi:flagellar motility protein MotE (MotC chaperone)